MSAPPRKSSRFDERYLALIGLLRSTRTRLGISQAELAALLGRDQSFVSKVELGERRIDVVELIDICMALHLDMTDVIAGLAPETQASNQKLNPNA